MEFYKLLAVLLKDKNLTRSDVCVLSVIVTYAQYQENQIAELSASDIQEIFETVGLRTIRRCIKHLAELHYIQTIKQKAPKKNKYKVLIDIPKGQAQPPIHQKKNPYKQSSEQTPIEEYERIARKNPFMQ